jgi:signal transduction histidine kinase
MSPWLWSVLIVLLALGAFAVDRVIMPERLNFVLYAVPILLASRHWRAVYVSALTAVLFLVAILDLYLNGHATHSDALGLAALIVVGILALHHAYQREELQRELTQQQKVISAVERLRQPLTVIFGYAQHLNPTSSDPALLARGVGAIRRAAAQMKGMLDDILTTWGTT